MGGQGPVKLVGAHGFRSNSQQNFWCGEFFFNKAASQLSGAVRAPRPRRCEFAAGPLPAHHRRTRCKYVLVALGRHPCRSRSRDGERAGPVEMVGVQSFQHAASSGLARRLCSSINHQPTVWCGVLADCGTVGGMGAATEPPWTG
ncbi:hypothetical protein FHR50_003395 [Xanthomonas arboricola]